jgi:hypothetical protein
MEYVFFLSFFLKMGDHQPSECIFFIQTRDMSKENTFLRKFSDWHIREIHLNTFNDHLIEMD